MYEYMVGYLIDVTDAGVTVDVNGIGFLLNVSGPLANEIRESDSTKKQQLFTHFLVRETGQQLYGFRDQDEREIFRIVLAVPGIGPKTALAVSGVVRNREDAEEAVEQKTLKIKGIGPKTVPNVLKALARALAPETARTPRAKKEVDIPTSARDNLLAMGYVAEDIMPWIEQHKAGSKSVADLVSKVVRHL